MLEGEIRTVLACGAPGIYTRLKAARCSFFTRAEIEAIPLSTLEIATHRSQ